MDRWAFYTGAGALPEVTERNDHYGNIGWAIPESRARGEFFYDGLFSGVPEPVGNGESDINANSYPDIFAGIS